MGTDEKKRDLCEDTCCASVPVQESINKLSDIPGNKSEYIVYGMDCSACANTIEKAVSKLDGVSEVHVNYISIILPTIPYHRGFDSRSQSQTRYPPPISASPATMNITIAKNKIECPFRYEQDPLVSIFAERSDYVRHLQFRPSSKI